VPLSQTAPSQSAPTPTSPEEIQRVREDIKKMSEGYFRLLAAKRFDEAYSQWNEAVVGVERATWAGDKQDFQLLAGNLVSVSVILITVYDNPREAPAPGLYVAADFQNSYKNVPYECGYLMWYRPVGGTFAITRSEIGHVTSAILNPIPVGQRPELLRKLRCVVP
jgi:hypothetical protein